MPRKAAFVFLLFLAVVSGRPFAPQSKTPAKQLLSPADFVPEKSAAADASLRGGELLSLPASNAEKFVTFTGIYVTFLALVCLASWETLVKIAPQFEAFPATKLSQLQIGTLALGWGAGKLAAVQSGEEATKKFCRLNVLPAGIAVYMAIVEGLPDLPVTGLLFLGYVYFGFFA